MLSLLLFIFILIQFFALIVSSFLKENLISNNHVHYVNQRKECPAFACTKTYLRTYMESINIGIINNLVELY